VSAADLGDMSRRLVEVLAAQGWSPGRRVDVDEWAEEIEFDGLVVSDVARAFWQSFGGLTIRPDRSGTILELDPTEVSGYDDAPVRWARRFGQSFCPIGVFNHSDGVWLGDRGAVLTECGGQHDRRIATSPAAGLEVLLIGKPSLWRRWRDSGGSAEGT
jgi:hypothetical protein